MSSSTSTTSGTSLKRGSCVCKAVQYTITGIPLTFRVCHCVNCKKATGSAFLTNGFFEEKQFSIIQGGDLLTKYSDSETASGHILERHFCKLCGSNVMLRSLNPQAIDKKMIIVCLGTLDDQVDWVPRTELFPHLRNSFVKGIVLASKQSKL